MPTRNVNLTEEYDREEQRYEAKLAALRAAIDEGDASGVSEGDPFERTIEALNLPTRR
jgi:hypothetical protein